MLAPMYALRIVGDVLTDTTQHNPITTDMKTTTTAQRIAALVKAINLADISQGRPKGIANRTAAPDDLNIRLDSSTYGGRILLADIDNHTMASPFAVLTMDEATTAKEICLERDLTEDDCVTHRGVTYVVVYLG